MAIVVTQFAWSAAMLSAANSMQGACVLMRSKNSWRFATAPVGWEVQLVPRYGSEKNPGTSCKDILVKNKLKKNNTPDGVHWIRFYGKR